MATFTTKPVVGQPAIIQRPGTWDSSFFTGYVVARVTPGGQVVVRGDDGQRELRFDSKLREMGRTYGRSILRLDIDACERDIEIRRSASEADRALRAVRVESEGLGTPSLGRLEERLATLEALLAEARVAVAARAELG